MALNSPAWWPPAMMTRKARPASGATSTASAARVSSAVSTRWTSSSRTASATMTTRSGGVGLAGRPGGQAGHYPGGADPLGKNIGSEEVLLHELAQSGGELIFALDDQRSVRYRQAKRTAEESRHREPVRNASDHGRLGAGLHIARQRAVDAGRSHGHEHNRHPRQESGSPPARRGQAARPHFRRLAPERGYRGSGHRRGRVHAAEPGQSAAQREIRSRVSRAVLSARQLQSRRIV